MNPVQFKDVNKASSDLLNNDYLFTAQKLKVSTKTENGVSFVTEGTLKKGKGVSGKLTASFKPFEGINVKKLAVTTDGRFQTEASMDNALDGVKVTLKAEEGASQPPAGELCVDYSIGSAVINSSVDVCDINGPTLYSAATFSYNDFLIGGEARYQTGFDSKEGAASLADYNAIFAYKGPDFTAAVSTKKKAADVSFNLHHHLSKDVQLASEYNHSSRLLTLGGLYSMDSSTKFQGKVNSSGVVSANAIQQVGSGVKLISSVEVDAKNFAGDSHKFGLQLVLG